MNTAIVLASGSGTRMGADIPKQFLDLGGRPIFMHSVCAFLRNPRIGYLVLVCREDWIERALGWMEREDAEKPWSIVLGGETRMDSGDAGLAAAPPETRIALIHDAARPFLGEDLISRLIDAAESRGAAVPLIAVADTLVEMQADGIGDVADRSRLGRVQTPQAFDFSLIRRAFEQARAEGIRNPTDDAQLVRRLGHPVAHVPGEECNFKITTAGDLELARALFQERQEKEGRHRGGAEDTEIERRSEIPEQEFKGRRMDDAEALALLERAELPELSAAAYAARLRHNPEHRVTYIVDRNINYTNVCTASCSFCAFSRRQGDADAYSLAQAELGRKIEETIALGGRQILLQGGMHPEFGVEAAEEMLRFIKGAYGIHIHGFSAPEIVAMARISRLPLEEALRRLRKAGLGSIPGGGAEILVERVRAALSPGKCTVEEWLGVHRAWHRMGGRSTATMMFGHIELLADRIEHLRRIRDLQDETGGFTAFIPWTFQPGNTRLQAERHIAEVGSWDYLRTLAVARLYLDNIRHIQSSWVTQGGRIGQISLFYGSDDMGSVMIEENVVRAAGAEFRMDEATLRRLIEEAGFEPRRRDCFYNLADEKPTVRRALSSSAGKTA